MKTSPMPSFTFAFAFVLFGFITPLYLLMCAIVLGITAAGHAIARSLFCSKESCPDVRSLVVGFVIAGVLGSIAIIVLDSLKPLI